MSNYVWKQVESIRQDMVSVLKDSGFEVMLMPNKLTINRGNEKVVEVNTKSTAPKELVDAASDSLYYRQNIAMMVTAMNAVIYLKGDITNAVKGKAHRVFGLYVKMVDYLRKHPTSRNIPVYSDEELIEEGEKFLNETETEITYPERFTDIIPDGNPFSGIYTPKVNKEGEPEKPKEVQYKNHLNIGDYSSSEYNQHVEKLKRELKKIDFIKEVNFNRAGSSDDVAIYIKTNVNVHHVDVDFVEAFTNKEIIISEGEYFTIYSDGKKVYFFSTYNCDLNNKFMYAVKRGKIVCLKKK